MGSLISLVTPSNSFPGNDIFSTDALKCRMIIEGIWRESHKNQPLSTDIISLCAKYYLIVLFPSPLPSQNYYLFNDEYIFSNLILKQSSIIGMCDTLKITVLNDLYLGTDSETNNYPCKIRCPNATIILHVFGDIYIGRNCCILNESPRGKDAIYIKCKNLFMKKGAKISSFQIDSYSYLRNDMLFGNIYMDIEKNLDVADGCDIMSGNIQVKCGGYAKIGVENGNVNVVAMNKLSMDVGDRLLLHERSKLYARNKKQLNRLHDGNLKTLTADYIHYSQKQRAKPLHYYPTPVMERSIIEMHHYPTPKRVHIYPTPQIEGKPNY